MNNLYRKVAVTSVGVVLGFALGANKEAKAATFTLTAIPFFIEGGTYSQADNAYGAVFRDGYFVEKETSFQSFIDYSSFDTRAFYEFNIGNLSLDTNTVIKRAILNTPLSNVQRYAARTLYLDLLGYVGNGIPDLSDFYAGRFIGYQNAVTPYAEVTFYSPSPLPEVNFDVTNFINQRVNNGDDFAGLAIRVENFYRNAGRATLLGANGQEPTLTIETVDVAEPVPEPTTIFGSAIGLWLGGWLKRKKSAQHNKTAL